MEIELRTAGELAWHGQPLPGPRMRALFDALIAASPRMQTSEDLIAEIWPDAPPANPKKALQILVARARGATASHVIESVSGGYRLGIAPSSVDVLAARELAREAQQHFDSGDVAATRAVLTEAADLRLGELSAQLRRLEALAAAQSGEPAALGRLEKLIGAPEFDSDEELLAAYFRALKRAQGPARAVQAFSTHRARLQEELGMDPGPLLQKVERELLGADVPIRTGIIHDATSLLGRDADLANLHRLLEQKRIVSIIGTGGLGKTRLARAIGRSTQLSQSHFVDLTAVNPHENLAAEIAVALNLRPHSMRGDISVQENAELRTQIARHLNRTPTLLILDNCEHVIEPIADLVAFLTASTTDLKILTTTRTALQVAGEHHYDLNALDVESAVELFTERARAVRTDAVLPQAETAQLVSQLEGIPLAIELAAAKMRFMSVAEIQDRLSDRFALLQGRMRTAPERHQTMFAVLDWSWNLLTPNEQRALQHFALLPGGLSTQLAEDIFPEGGIPALEALIEQSLLNVTEVSAGVRYRMFETVREFALHQLEQDSQERVRALAARTNWAGAYSKRLCTALHGPDQISAMNAVRAEETNLSEAAQYAVAADEAEAALQILTALVWYWIIAGQFQRILMFFGTLETKWSTWNLDETAAENVRIVLTGLLIPQAFGVRLKGENLRQTFEELGASNTIDPVRGFGEVLLTLGVSEQEKKLQKLEALGQHPDPNIAMPALQGLAYMHENGGDPRRVAEVIRRSLAISDPAARPWPRVMQEALLAQLHLQLGEVDVAQAYASEILGVLNELGAIEEMRVCHAIFTVAALHASDFAAAERELEQLEEFDKRHGYLDSSIGVLGRAELAFARGETAEGLALYDQWRQHAPVLEVPGVIEQPQFAPWLLFSEATTLVAFARFGAEGQGRELFHSLTDKLWQLTNDPPEWQDYPALGMVPFAVGVWGLLREELPAQKCVRLMGIAKAMSYNRISPSMAWERIIEPAEAAAPGLLATIAEQTRGKRGQDLLPILGEVLRD